MNEPLPHYVNIAEKLASYGISAEEPTMFILGSQVVTAEIDARRACQGLTIAMQRVATGDGLLDDFHGDELVNATEALTAFHRARRALLKAADEQGLRQVKASS
jgi:hypothetical protein